MYCVMSKGVQYHTVGSAHLNDPSKAHASAIPSGSLKWHVGDKNGQNGGFGIWFFMM